MEKELVIYFVGYEDDIGKALANTVYLDFGSAAKVYRRATRIVGLDGMRLFQAVVTHIEQVVPDDYKLLKSL
jgi:hypothetical protein